MIKNNLQSGIGSICLTFFIMFCYVLTLEKAFTREHWLREYMVVEYNQNHNYIIFDFLIYDYCFSSLDKQGYMSYMKFEYSEDGYKYNHLMKVETQFQECKDWTTIKMKEKKIGEKIQILNCYNVEHGMLWNDNDKELNVKVNVSEKRFKKKFQWVESKKSYMKVKWFLPSSSVCVKSIKIIGSWLISNHGGSDLIGEIYMLDNVKSSSIKKKKNPSECISEISDKVKISVETDAIIVSGVERGENIKVFTTTGTVVKSIVATNVMVNLKLATNQIFIVKTGQAHFKLAL